MVGKLVVMSVQHLGKYLGKQMVDSTGYVKADWKAEKMAGLTVMRMGIMKVAMLVGMMVEWMAELMVDTKVGRWEIILVGKKDFGMEFVLAEQSVGWSAYSWD
jgi:hypothetical protein